MEHKIYAYYSEPFDEVRIITHKDDFLKFLQDCQNWSRDVNLYTKSVLGYTKVDSLNSEYIYDNIKRTYCNYFELHISADTGAIYIHDTTYDLKKLVEKSGWKRDYLEMPTTT